MKSIQVLGKVNLYLHSFILFTEKFTFEMQKNICLSKILPWYFYVMWFSQNEALSLTLIEGHQIQNVDKQ